MAGLNRVLSLTALATVLFTMGGGVSGEKKLSHPALTRGAALSMKVLYWLVISSMILASSQMSVVTE